MDCLSRPSGRRRPQPAPELYVDPLARCVVGIVSITILESNTDGSWHPVRLAADGFSRVGRVDAFAGADSQGCAGEARRHGRPVRVSTGHRPHRGAAIPAQSRRAGREFLPPGQLAQVSARPTTSRGQTMR